MRGLSKIAVPIGVVAIVLMLVVPLPAALLDLLLGLNITASLLIILVAMQIKKPLDFAVFPSLILIATLFRLSLNVSSTRLVLTDGYAGKVIEAFGHFVIGGSLVGARFTLDAMPGKQMAIDADLNAGPINEAQARKRRTEVTAEADFYGSMDGASKFVKGDAIAAIIVTLINLIGGFAIGVIQKGMAPADAVSTYSLLSVGDGLVSQIPALRSEERHVGKECRSLCDWSSDVCSSDLVRRRRSAEGHGPGRRRLDLLAAQRRRRPGLADPRPEIGRASCRERV